MFSKEILQAFVRELGDDTKALMDCSLVSRWFLEAARRTLFHTINLHAARSSIEERARLLSDFLPDVGRHICIVSLQLDRVPGPHLSKLLQSLTALPKIHTTRLIGMRPFPVGGELLRLLSMPSLTTLQLCNLNDLPDAVVCRTSRLRHLRLAGVVFQQDSPLCALIPRSAAIVFDNATKVDAFGLPPIQKITMRIGSDACLSVLIGILQRSSASLVGLSV